MIGSILNDGLPTESSAEGLGDAAPPSPSGAMPWMTASLGELGRDASPPSTVQASRARATRHELPPAPEGSRDAAFNNHALLEQAWLHRATVHDRAQIRQFLRHLEVNDSSWAALVPDPQDRRPIALERAVNEAIAHHGVDKSARGSINKMFDLELRGPAGRAPIKRNRPLSDFEP